MVLCLPAESAAGFDSETRRRRWQGFGVRACILQVCRAAGSRSRSLLAAGRRACMQTVLGAAAVVLCPCACAIGVKLQAGFGDACGLLTSLLAARIGYAAGSAALNSAHAGLTARPRTIFRMPSEVLVRHPISLVMIADLAARKTLAHTKPTDKSPVLLRRRYTVIRRSIVS